MHPMTSSLHRLAMATDTWIHHRSTLDCVCRQLKSWEQAWMTWLETRHKLLDESKIKWVIFSINKLLYIRTPAVIDHWDMLFRLPGQPQWGPTERITFKPFWLRTISNYNRNFDKVYASRFYWSTILSSTLRIRHFSLSTFEHLIVKVHPYPQFSLSLCLIQQRLFPLQRRVQWRFESLIKWNGELEVPSYFIWCLFCFLVWFWFWLILEDSLRYWVHVCWRM
jgi:hypothetical protein